MYNINHSNYQEATIAEGATTGLEEHLKTLSDLGGIAGNILAAKGVKETATSAVEQIPKIR